MKDEDLINEVSSWERAAQASRERHRKRIAWVMLAVLGAAVVAVAVSIAVPACAAKKERDAAAAQERRALQDEAWVACVDALGLEQCRLVRAGVAEQCLRGGQQAADVKRCLQAEVQP